MTGMRDGTGSQASTAAITPYRKEIGMNPTLIDPRAVAEMLGMDTYKLAEQLSAWAYEALPSGSELFGNDTLPMSLDDFDAAIAKARRYHAGSIECMKACLEDNPIESEDETA